MGDALVELEQIFRSSKYQLTREEANVFHTCRARSVRDFIVGACVASGAVWTATRSLRYAMRINLSVGAAVFSGGWRFNRSLDSCLGDILSLEGSRMQKELANLILKKYRDDPWRMQLVNKHFYLEKVFDDLSIDKPISRWRHRNFFGENVAQSQRTQNVDSDSEPTDMEAKQSVMMTSSVDVIADPLDCVFGGYGGKGEEIHHLDTTGVSPRRRIRANKRAHRRHQMQQQEVSSTSQFAQAQVE
ncbi:uncharacterized protein LOC122091389 isoform X2 [Macadamia integrifolia]|uniref:uncharacterized protein LOC122091389 isoform X2 n=1 Tax=Macadamia integrifolia TaxID=60698 RepID=UPI001C4EB4C6|nr:uncharacterized protein LOC122091389 isoform X2 [Macadamia integrifolia]